MDWVVLTLFMVVLEEVLLAGPAVREEQQLGVMVVVVPKNTPKATAAVVVLTMPAPTRTILPVRTKATGR